MSNDSEAIRELAAHSDASRAHMIIHYLYIPDPKDAAPVSRLLQQQGFQVEDRLGGDGVNWLILATHQLIPTNDSIAAARRLMESLATRYGGEYDGWEAQVADSC